MKTYGKLIRVFSAAALLLTGLVVNTAVADDTIRMGSRLEFYDVVYREGGFDKKYGLKAEGVPFATGVEVVTALQSGEIDIASSGHVPMTVLLSKTDTVMVVATAAYNKGSIYRMVVGKDTNYKTIDDLKGKVVATKLGSGSYKAFSSYLAAKGLSEKDFQIKNAGPGAIVGAMQAGSVDAGIWFEPTISLILHKGFGRVLLDFDGHAIFQVHWLVNRKFAEAHPDRVARFLAGAMDAQEMLVKDPKEAAALIAKGYQARGRDYPAGVFELGIPLINFDPAITDEHLKEIKGTFDFLKKAGRVRGDEPDWQSMITTKYLAEAQKLRK